MDQSIVLIALLLGVWAYISAVGWLSGLWWTEALIGGALAGFLVGDLELGLKIGATLTFMSLGMWTYGGATIPDFNTGAIIGTVVGSMGGGMEAGLVVAVPVALLMSQLDVLAGIIDTAFVHGAEKYIEREHTKGITYMHVLGHLPWCLTRGIAVFLAIWLGAAPIQALINATPEWFTKGMTVVGNILPALGFAVLLTQMNVKKYWPFLLIGYVLYGYFQTPIMGIAILAVAIGIIFKNLEGRNANGCSVDGE